MDAALFLSVLALAAGPLFGGTGPRSAAGHRYLDAFVVVVIAGLVLLHILPHGFAHCGWPAILALVVGLVVPMAAHQALHGHLRERWAVLGVSLLALAVHATLDGVGLAGIGDDEAGAFIALAVLLHRGPMAVAIWWMTRATFGVKTALAVLGMVGVATVLGFELAGTVLDDSSLWTMGMIQAAMGGALLHVVVHHGPPTHDSRPESPWPAVFGVATGCAVLLGLSITEAAQGEPYGGIRIAASLLIGGFALRRALRPPTSEHHGHHHHSSS